MEAWGWILVAASVATVIVIVGAFIFYVKIWRKAAQAQAQQQLDQDVQVGQGGVRLSEEALLLQAQGILARFQENRPPARLGVVIPRGGVEIRQEQVAQFDALAQEAAQAQYRADLRAQTSSTLLEAGQGIRDAIDAAKEFDSRAADSLAAAYQTLGLELPPLRSEQEIFQAAQVLGNTMASTRTTLRVNPCRRADPRTILQQVQEANRLLIEAERTINELRKRVRDQQHELDEQNRMIDQLKNELCTTTQETTQPNESFATREETSKELHATLKETTRGEADEGLDASSLLRDPPRPA